MAKYFYDQPGKFHETVRQLVNNDGRQLVILAGDMKVPAIWLQKFADGRIANPSVNRLEYVYEQLTGNPLPTE